MRFHRPKGLLAGFSWKADHAGASDLLEAGEQWLPRDRPIPTHVNKGWEVYFQPLGVSLWECQGRNHRVEAGGYYLAAPRVRHRLLSFENAETHFYYAVLPEPPRPGDPPRPWPKPFHSGPAGHALETPFRGLVRELTRGGTDMAEGIACYARALALEIGRLLHPATTASPAGLHPAVVRACDLIETRPGDPWKLDELASLAGVSIPHLVSLFRRDLATSPRQYLLRRRIERAEVTLRSSDRPVTDLALELGFSSSQHFARTFRSQKGYPPSKCRQPIS